MSLSALGRIAREVPFGTGLENFDEPAPAPEAQRIEDAEQQTDEVTAQANAEAVQNDVEALAGESAALEQYVGILTRAKANGGLNADEAAFMHVGLRAYTRKTGIVMGVASIEDFGGTVSGLKATTISLEALKDHAKAAWEAFKMAIKAAIQAMGDWYQKTFSGARKVADRAKALKQEVAALRGAPDTAEFELSNTGNYCVDGKFVGQDNSELGDLITYFTKTWGSNVLGIVLDFNKLISGYKFEDLNYSTTAMGILRHLPQGGFVSTKVDGDSRFRKDATIARSKTLPGNQALFQSTPPPDDGSVWAAFAQVSFRVLPVLDAAAAPGTVTVKTSQTSTLTKRLDDVIRMAGQLEHLSDTKAKIENALNDQMDALSTMRMNADVRDFENQDQSKAFIDPEATMTSAINSSTQLQRMATTDFNGVLSYAVRMLGAQLALVQAEVSHYGATSAAPGRALPSPT